MELTQEKLQRLAKNIFLIEFAKLMNVTPMELIVPDKRAEITLIRNLYYFWRSKKYKLTHEQIGREINRDRSTVSHGIRRIVAFTDIEDKKTIAYLKMIEEMPCAAIQHPQAVVSFKPQGQISEKSNDAP